MSYLQYLSATSAGLLEKRQRIVVEDLRKAAEHKIVAALQDRVLPWENRVVDYRAVGHNKAAEVDHTVVEHRVVDRKVVEYRAVENKDLQRTAVEDRVVEGLQGRAVGVLRHTVAEVLQKDKVVEVLRHRLEEKPFHRVVGLVEVYLQVPSPSPMLFSWHKRNRFLPVERLD
jgi:hypothetical protein